MVYEIIDQNKKIIYFSKIYDDVFSYYTTHKDYWRDKNRFITIKSEKKE